MALPFAVCDCETDPFKFGRTPRPFIWGFFDGADYHEFDDTTDFLVFAMRYRGYIYAHNGGKFDFYYLLEIIEGDLPLDIIGSRVAQFRFGDAVFRDSYSILPEKLEKLTHKLDIDYAKLEPSVRAQHMPEIRRYLKQDCVGLYGVLTAWFARYPRGLTLAGTALNVWRSMGGRVDKSTPAFYERFHPYYYGGRVQCFEGGHIKGPLTYHDIHSAYPKSMMSKHPCGAGQNAYIMTKTVTDSDYFKTMFTIEGVSFGALPWRCDQSKKLYFPDDGITRVYHVPGYELIKAIETGSVHIRKIIRAYTFKETITFSEYVERFYTIKSSAVKGTPDYTFAKLFLNSLYGKLASNPARYSDYLLADWRDNISGYTPGNVMPGTTRQLFSAPVPEMRQNYYNVVTAASITGQVRGMLFDGITSSQGVVYCDTDSVICRNFGGRVGNDLGQWGLDAKFDDLYIGGKKLYSGLNTLDNKHMTASKGVQLTHNEIVTIAKGGEIEYESDVPTISIKSGINNKFTRTIRSTL